MVEAFVLVRVQPRRADETANVMKNVKEEILKIQGVKEIKGVFGRYDFVVIADVKTIPELGSLVTDRIRSIRGVVETETLVVGF
jgi:DNA-binding Lrp family transcriptional regulator